jgi:hypothetical protein
VIDVLHAHQRGPACGGVLALCTGTAAGVLRFDLAAPLARELETRRLTRAANVITLDPQRRREGGGR